MTNQQIDAIFNAMPGGVQGFCREFGYQQFARAVLEAASLEIEEERERWRSIVSRAAADGNRYGREGITAACTSSETGQMLSWRIEQPT